MTGIRVIATFLLIGGIALGLFAYEHDQHPYKLGLDLAGGALLTYEADISNLADSEDIEGAMSALRDVIERRVNVFGVGEPRVSVETARLSGETSHRLIVELPGVTDIDAAIKQLGETPLLEFRLLRTDLTTNELETIDVDSAGYDAIYQPAVLTGQYLQSARVQFGGGSSVVSEPLVAISFNKEGGDIFEQITRDHIGEQLAVFLDGDIITSPVIQSVITSGQAVITGNFTPEEARDLAQNLNFGALPVPIELVGTQNIGGSLGSEAVAAGVTASLWGLALVALFMIVWYRIPGLIAVLSLGIYVTVMLALFKLIPVTLTAAGIAGFILSVGMAVDANVLIFERLKEELADGRQDLRDAIRNGFKRAWASIRDGNLTSIFTAIILFYTTTSLVKGFALTFGLGVIVSMITAIGVTRTLLLAVSPEKRSALFNSGLTK